MVGRTILNYTITRRIAEGGMGTVYEASDIINRKLAIKILDPGLTRNPEFVKRFIREAKTLSSLDHPKIVKVHQLFDHSGSYFMVMEFAEGETLKDLVRRTGPVPEYRAVMIIKQIAEGLSFAHSKGIIHRDIKPENVIIDVNDNVKILDFGIAKLVFDNSLTRTGTKMGTIYYMSPEQIKADCVIDYRTDIYSLGIVFYEILTGKLPFSTASGSDFAIMKEIVEGYFTDPRKYYPHISDHVVAVLYKMINRNRDFRLPSLNEVLTLNGSYTDTVYLSPPQFDTEEYYCLSCNARVPRPNEMCEDCKSMLPAQTVYSGPKESGKIYYDEVTKQEMFKHPFSFNGRIRRTEFGISMIVYYTIFFFMSTVVSQSTGEPAGLILILSIPLFWFLFAQGAKRCHDLGTSGFFQLIPFYFLWMLFQDGDYGGNMYGPNPKGINFKGYNY